MKSAMFMSCRPQWQHYYRAASMPTIKANRDDVTNNKASPLLPHHSQQQSLDEQKPKNDSDRKRGGFLHNTVSKYPASGDLMPWLITQHITMATAMADYTAYHFTVECRRVACRACQRKTLGFFRKSGPPLDATTICTAG